MRTTEQLVDARVPQFLSALQGSGGVDVINIQKITWAMAMVTSRAFILPSKDNWYLPSDLWKEQSFLPLIDMMNHASSTSALMPEGVGRTNVRVVFRASGNVEAEAICSIRQGEELLIEYSKEDKDLFLTNFGFVG